MKTSEGLPLSTLNISKHNPVYSTAEWLWVTEDATVCAPKYGREEPFSVSVTHEGKDRIC